MKILVISTLYSPHVIGGAEKAATMLAEAMVGKGLDVVVISLHPEAEERVEERNGVRVYRLPLDNFYWPFNRAKKPGALSRIAWHVREMWNRKAARRIGRILDIEAPDVVHTHNISGFSVAAWREVKRRNIHLVHTLHDYYLMCSRYSLFRRGDACEQRCSDCRVLTFNRKGASRMPDALVSVSNYTLDHHKRLGYFQNVPPEVIYNIQAVKNTRVVSPLATSKDPAVLTFGFIGRIEEEKGIETLLRATQLLVQSNWRLKIAGKGIEAYVKGLQDQFPDPRIEWMGFTAAPDFYAAVDTVVIPSQWAEPLPYVCVESLHAGKALICARVGGLPEIAQLSNVVKLFSAGSVAELSKAMNDALADSSRWKESAPPASSVLNQFTEEAVLEKYMRVYQVDASIIEKFRHTSNALV